MIAPYSIHRSDRVPNLFECCSALLIAFLAGWIASGLFNAGLDAFNCYGAEYINGIDWRRDDHKQ